MNGDPGDGFFNVLGPTADIGRVCHIIPLLDGVLDMLCPYTVGLRRLYIYLDILIRSYWYGVYFLGISLFLGNPYNKNALLSFTCTTGLYLYIHLYLLFFSATRHYLSLRP